MFVTVTLLATCLGLLFIYLWRLKSRYSYFAQRNIAGPPPGWFFGHSLTLWNTPSLVRQIQEWTRQFGSLYGIYEGTRPIYVVSDVDFLQEVLIKQFSSFHSRRSNILNRALDTKGAHLFSANADQWRRQRQVINPTFTALKMKTMTPLINECIESLMVKLHETHGGEFNIYALYKRLTMDVICE